MRKHGKEGFKLKASFSFIRVELLKPVALSINRGRACTSPPRAARTARRLVVGVQAQKQGFKLKTIMHSQVQGLKAGSSLHRPTSSDDFSTTLSPSSDSLPYIRDWADNSFLVACMEALNQEVRVQEGEGCCKGIRRSLPYGRGHSPSAQLWNTWCVIGSGR